jgi:hypothetical protein
MDAKLLFGEDQAETTVAAHDSTNVIDLGAGYDAFGTASGLSNPGEGDQLWLNVVVTTAFTSGGAATLTVALNHSTDNSSWTVVLQTPAIALATLVAGYQIIRMPLPANLNRYLKMIYTIGTAVMTAGAVSAWIDHGFQSNK